jgi:hypothetical protein
VVEIYHKILKGMLLFLYYELDLLHGRWNLFNNLNLLHVLVVTKG